MQRAPGGGKLDQGSETGPAQSGGTGLQLTGRVTAPAGPTAVRVRNQGSAAMVSPTLTVLLP